MKAMIIYNNKEEIMEHRSANIFVRASWLQFDTNTYFIKIKNEKKKS